MIDQNHSTAASNLVAIDIAKDWNVALVQDTSGRRHRFKFANRDADHDRFVQFLHSLSGPVKIGLEPTGDYHRPIAHRLLREGFEVVSISSLALARFREARFGTRDKNDPKDAQVIIAMMQQGLVQVYWDPLISGAHDWQELSNTYFHITLVRTRPNIVYCCIICRSIFRSSLATDTRPGRPGSFTSCSASRSRPQGRQASQTRGDLRAGRREHWASGGARLTCHQDVASATVSLCRVKSAPGSVGSTRSRVARRQSGLSAFEDPARCRRDHRFDDPGGRRRSAALSPSPAVSKVLWAGSR